MIPDGTSWFMVFARIGALLFSFPLFSSQNIPVKVRLGLAAVAACLISPLLPPLPSPISSWQIILLLFGEILIGLCFGFVCRMIFFAIEVAGGIIATETGLMLSAAFNPLSSAGESAASVLLHWLAIILFFTLDLHHWLLVAFQKSYLILPVGGVAAGEALLTDVLSKSSAIFSVAVQMVAPVITASFAVTLLFSLLARAVPQMNAFSESFAARIVAGLAVFGMGLTLMAQHICNYLARIPSDLLKAAELLHLN